MNCLPAYQQWGDSNAPKQLILLHGWGMNSGVWNETAGQLTSLFPGLKIIAVDLPGYGQSKHCDLQALGGHYNSTTLARSLNDLLGDRHNIVIAWSMGGLVALELVKQCPQFIAQLVLVSSSPRFVQAENWQDAVKPRIFEDFYQSLEQDHQATLKRFLAIQAMGSVTARKDIKTLQAQLAERGEADPQALKYGLKMLLNEDKRALLTQITDIPVDLICGQRDTLVNIKAQELLARQKNIRLHAVAGAGHAPFISHPEVFIKLLRESIEY